MFEEGIFNHREVLIERDDSAFARFVGELDELPEDRFSVRSAGEEDRDELLQCGQKDVDRELQHDGADRAPNDDHRRGWLGDLRDASALHHHSGEDADDRECDATDAGDIHSFLFGFPFQAPFFEGWS